ncbi:polysaccharide pyruvyl transferase CsaB [Geomicrobium halophilum]|uniref:Polysaccharide pyruvyl transferase CsaB n=1 Tax=Geomicrobium halophilum TaxID=549000 RepID=A0A841Q2A6_9BACL|nr:polysaccharide pyruvyl transferase family protein [Geomicrobium halophilum]MBB6450388.1 polysaccharide pyruvyl transferase CsaB [Geomicrobium halophilum]
MKIGIIGNYGHDNNGDEAILQGVLSQLKEIGVSIENIVIFSNNPDKTKERFQVQAVPLLEKRGTLISSVISTSQQAKKTMADLDVVILGGGGLLMDMYKRDAPLYSTLGSLAKKSGCRLLIHAVGAGPITTTAGKFFIKRLVKQADAVTVRDEQSQRLLSNITGRQDITVIDDPAFAIPNAPSKEKTASIQRIGITAAPYYSKRYWPTHDEDKYQKYIKGIAAAADKIIETHGAALTFFSTKYPEDVDVSRDIHAAMTNQKSATLIDTHLGPDAILETAAKQDVVIGTRLHSLILAVKVCTPVIGIEYHHKVRHFMEQMDEAPFSHEIPNSQEGIIHSIHHFQNHWEATQNRFARKSSTIQDQAVRSLDSYEWLHG